MAPVTTFITRLTSTGTGIRLAVKDAIDVAGVPTTAGCPAVADDAAPADVDAACLAGARAAGARIVGKTNLHELCFGGTGVNEWYGTPVNPLDPARIPGGSSSGSAVAVATGEADVALGTDTAGSIRTPSACCGTVGLKTTFGRIPLAGVWPLAPSLDTVGPMGATVAAVALGMALLEPGFAPTTAGDVVGRVRLRDTDPAVDDAIDRALAAAGVRVVAVELDGWAAADAAAVTVLFAEAWRSDGALATLRPDRVGDDLRSRLDQGRRITGTQLAAAEALRALWQRELEAALAGVEALVLPSLRTFAPRLDEPVPNTRYASAPINLAGNPALALPVPARGPLPAGLQLIGPPGGEEQLLAIGARVEAAVGTVRAWHGSE
jgi:amidase